jgi:hypothetical protein
VPIRLVSTLIICLLLYFGNGTGRLPGAARQCRASAETGQLAQRFGFRRPQMIIAQRHQ